MMWFLLQCLCFAAAVSVELTRDLEISEAAQLGTRVGFIGDGFSGENGPPYFIIPVQGSSVENDFDIDQKTGEIKTKVQLDRETKSSYYFVAVPITGQNIHVTIKIIDENDNSPTFSTDVMNIEFPENTPKDVKRTLNPAKDLDTGIYNTQRYDIVSGNTNNAFRLSFHREKDGVLYLDLQINGILDRETISAYSLVIEAVDGGSPPLRGTMTVNIAIQDINDNQPVFNQTRYFGTVPENATIGTSVLTVHATDADSGDNGIVEYSINRRQSDRDNFFTIDPQSGLILVNKHLDFEAKEMHELVIVAKDRGVQPLETVAFVSIRVTDVNDNQPIINLIFLSDDATPKISEDTKPGEFVARIFVNDPDSKTEYSNVNVTLEGGDGHFGLTTQDSIIYLMVVSLPIDREKRPNYTLSVVATDTGNPPLHAFRMFDLEVTDVNDNPPEFEKQTYYANVLEVAELGSSVIQVLATDRDEGNNSEISYSIVEVSDVKEPWFQIDSKSGLITTRSHVECELDPTPQLIVMATDNGNPPLSSTATIIVTIHDINDNEPIFTQTFYNATITEDTFTGTCILKISATDSDCGVNAMVNYTILESSTNKINPFYVKSVTGDICISSQLDYEDKKIHEFFVVATDRGGLSATSAVKIILTDVNDNVPVFYPKEYKITIREDISTSSAITIVKAQDIDSGRFGIVQYRISRGNDDNLFSIDRNTGEIFVTRTNSLNVNREYILNVSTADGADSKSNEDALVFITVSKSQLFDKSRFVFSAAEDLKIGDTIGMISLKNTDTELMTRYYITDGDFDGFFSLDSSTGLIKVASIIDYERHHSVLLNIQAIYGDYPSPIYTQAVIKIEDKNDNKPEFEWSSVRISVPENAEIGAGIYTATAFDRDSSSNGEVHYLLSPSSLVGENRLFAIDRNTGLVTLTRALDYESNQRHAVMIFAMDSGEPSLQNNMSLLIEVQDVNDNSPVFEQSEYRIVISESLPIHSQILQVGAVDLDTGNNAKITYKLSEMSDTFGISGSSGWIYLKKLLDRESVDKHTLKIIAADNGLPRNSATTLVHITVSDANDNEPRFLNDFYEFKVEENGSRGTLVGLVKAVDIDLDNNAIVRYSLIPSNTTFQINSFSGEITTKETLDREQKAIYELIVEARDQGTPPRSSRVPIRIFVLDVNDNAPVIVDPQEDVVSVREQQPPGTEVVHVRAVDPDDGYNASLSYSILKDRDTDGYGVFLIDRLTGVIKTRSALDHEERSMYRVAVAATDNGSPPKQTVRILRIEVLDVNDNRPTFSSSSLFFQVREDAPIGFIIGNVINAESSVEPSKGQLTYSLNFLSGSEEDKVFDIDRRSGTLIVSRLLDRESRSEYRLEVRAADYGSNPQSIAVIIKIEILDVNDNAPKFHQDPLIIKIKEDFPIGSTIWNFSAFDLDYGINSEIRYKLISQFPPTENAIVSVDGLTGQLIMANCLDFESITEYMLLIQATDQALNITERLTGSVTVRLIVNDVNDNAPIIIAPVNKNIIISNSSPKGTIITHVIAIDNDEADNEKITYKITDGNDKGYFIIDQVTGIITLSKNIIKKENFIINVTAFDNGLHNNLYSVASLNISVQNNPDSQFMFSEQVYRVSLSEDAPIATTVITLSVNNPIHQQGTPGNKFLYEIPNGVADDAFEVDKYEGIVKLRKTVDREKVDKYVIPITVKNLKTLQSDSAVILVNLLDVNDNSPQFNHGACYPLHVPENSDKESTIIHQVVATDLDIENNAKILYSIAGGNSANRFHVNPSTGSLSAFPLDREVQSRYHLTILAQDQGILHGPLTGYCNITIYVDDENDNDPQFQREQYSTSISEDTPIGTTVITVKATDLDLGANGKITYSIKNETDWRFTVDNKTGEIILIGALDREKADMYEFQVIASDSGKYRSRFQITTVKITIEDINDNRPVFDRCPFVANVSPYSHVGSEIIRVTATDNDRGANSEILFRLQNGFEKFRISPNTGVISASSSLISENGKSFILEVIATDKGNPPLTSTGIVEIRIGDVDGNPSLRFQNTSYAIDLMENPKVDENLLQVFALRTDGRRQRISYNIVKGNENGALDINPQSGIIRVRNSTAFDFEENANMHFVVMAQGENMTNINPLTAFADFFIYLKDQNDNIPIFTQHQYFATISEGDAKGTVVIQVKAMDGDSDHNSRLSYHIVDGNHDNAFTIEPASSNIIKTNIVLDAEIRNTYKLTVIATDEGIPQLTATTTIRINVIDVNDNQPSFPPSTTISVSEGELVGSVITSITANDVDSYPNLIYQFDDNTNEDMHFSIDRYTGRVILIKPLDYETKTSHKLNVIASDGIHKAHTSVTIIVNDENDNVPVFNQQFYQFSLPESNSKDDKSLRVSASDGDSGENGIISFSLINHITGFSIDKNLGYISINYTLFTKDSLQQEYFDFLVMAEDNGKTPLSSLVPIRFQRRFNIQYGLNTPSQSEYRVTLKENTNRGKSVIKLGSVTGNGEKTYYSIIAGNEEGKFDILNPNGDIILIKKLDRETTDVYSLQIGIGRNTSTIYVHVIIEDSNDNRPQFTFNEYIVNISESVVINTSLIQFTATDLDLPPNSNVYYEILSGNDKGYFYIDKNTGNFRTNSYLDYDCGVFDYNVVIHGYDGAKAPYDYPLSSITSLKIILNDENDNIPKFPITEYLASVGENEPIGSKVFKTLATDLDKGIYGKLNYSLASAAAIGYADVDDSWKLFNVDSSTGLVTTNSIFDYETRSRYAISLYACDYGGKCSKVTVKLEIESKDEFHPQFTERSYRFILPGDVIQGYVVGHVMATDRDKGPDGRIIYQLTSQSPYFKMNRTTGAIIVKKKLERDDNVNQDISLIVSASSGRQGSLTNVTVVEIVFDPLFTTNLANTVANSSTGISTWLISLLLIFIIIAAGAGITFVFFHFRKSRQKNMSKSHMSTTQRVDSYVDPGAFDTIPIRTPMNPVTQFGPPKYDEIPTYRASNSSNCAPATNELSGSEQSGSSGRGSAEDAEDVDEEIRMINEGQPRREADDDNLSDVSVHNTQEYLARLGIVDSQNNSSVQNDGNMSHRKSSSIVRMNMFEDEPSTEPDITNIIYAKLNDVTCERGGSSNDDRSSTAGGRTTSVDRTMNLDGYAQVAPGTQPSMSGSLSSIVHSEEELTGSYNWDYLLDWGPQYQPLAHVFSEIARLKDDAVSVKSGNSGTSSGKSKCMHAASKSVPPPLLTNVAPRSIAAPIISSRQHHHSTPMQNAMLHLPRSPISHDTVTGFSTSTAMSPSFSPSLSPLATRSPSSSPLHLHPVGSTGHHLRQRHHGNDSDIRI